MKFLHIFTFCTPEKPKKALSLFLSVNNAHRHVYVRFSQENGQIELNETLHKAGSYTHKYHRLTAVLIFLPFQESGRLFDIIATELYPFNRVVNSYVINIY